VGVRIERRSAGDVTILEFSGEWDSFNLREISARVEQLIRGRPARLVFNVRDLRFLTSSPLGYLISVHQRLRAERGGLVLSEASPYLRSTIRTLGLHRFFRMCETDQDAVVSFAVDAGERDGPSSSPAPRA